MTTESRAAACAGITSWGIQAPSMRLGTEPFKEVVTGADVVSFNKCFNTAVEIIESVSMVDCYLTYMLETDEQANEIPQYAEDHGVTSYKLYMQTRGMKGMPPIRTTTGRRAARGWARGSMTARCTW
jgi:dihydropyrimidinase/dihydroorotase